jgi:hypothetical protein
MGKRGVCLTAGPLLMLLGGLPFLFVQGFPGPARPELKGWAYWSTFLGNTFDLSKDAGWISLTSSVIFVCGLALFALGVFTLVQDCFRTRSE